MLLLYFCYSVLIRTNLSRIKNSFQRKLIVLIGIKENPSVVLEYGRPERAISCVRFAYQSACCLLLRIVLRELVVQTLQYKCIELTSSWDVSITECLEMEYFKWMELGD